MVYFFFSSTANGSELSSSIAAIMEPDAEAEKMAALKRAYADIILNTAKESAARILASERRALCFQQSLLLAKEEALATMLRLKSLMDSKIKEAEMTSLNQVKRIQELEVQLSQAEHTIGSLKVELQKVNNGLKIGKNDSIDPLNEQKASAGGTSDDGKCQESQPSSASNLHPSVAPGSLITVDIICTTSGQKNKDTHCCFTGNAPQAQSSKRLLAERECGGNPDLASIIMRSKKPELYRNVCTQRIHAFEHNVLTVKVPNEQIDGQPPNFMNLSNVYENEKVQRSHSVDSAKAVKTASWKSRNSFESEGHVQSSDGGSHAVKLFHRFSRKPRTRCIYVKPTDAATSNNQGARCHQPLDAAASKKSRTILATKSTSEEPPHKLMKSHSTPISGVRFKRAEDKTLGMDIISGSEISGLLPCNNRTVTEQFVVMQNQDDSRNEISQSFPCHTENKEDGNSIEDLTMSSTIETKDGILLNGIGENDDAKLLQIDDLKLTLADQNITENSDVLEMKDGSSVIHSNSKAKTACESGEALPEVRKDRFIKYTFQRTRKKGSLNSKNESIVPEKISGKRKSGDKQNILPEPLKPSLAADFPRNDRRVMQVARQLISLSEKRW